MENLDKKLKDLSSVDVPSDLHKSIMRNVNYKKILPLLLIPFLLLSLNFIIVSWHINMKLMDAEWKDMLIDLFEGFDFTFDYFKTIAYSFFEIVPVSVVIVFIFSLLGVFYTSIRLIKANKERSGK